MSSPGRPYTGLEELKREGEGALTEQRDARLGGAETAPRDTAEEGLPSTVAQVAPPSAVPGLEAEVPVMEEKEVIPDVPEER